MQSKHAIILHSLDDVISDWNTGAEEIFGYARSEAVGKRGSFLVPDDVRDEHQEIMRRIARGEEVSRPESMRLHKSGRRVEVRLTASPLRDRDGKLVGAVTALHDQSDLRLLEHQCQQAHRMQTFGQLASGVVHDFNNQLTVILGLSEVLLNRAGASEPKPNLAAEIHKAGKRAAALVSQLRVFNNKQTVAPRVLDLSTVVADTEILLHRLIGADIRLTTNCAPNLHGVKLDPEQIQQMLLHLAANARDAMPSGGRLTLTTANVTRNGRADGYVMLSIGDTGIGMDATTRSQLVQRPCNAKSCSNETEGGLATVMRIVETGGGDIEIDSEPGKGSTFRLFFPSADATPAAVARPAPDGMPQGTETILLVDDEEVVRSLASRILRMCGYTVLEANAGEQALWIGVNHTGPIHMLVSDVLLPQFGGGELAKRMLALNPQLEVLLVSGYPIDLIAEQGIMRPEFGFLQKPFATTALAQKVRRMLDRS